MSQCFETRGAASLVRQLLDLRVLRRVAVIWLALAVVSVSVGAWSESRLLPASESLLVLAVALCALAFGLRGGAATAAIATALTTVLLLAEQTTGVVDCVARSVIYVLAGCFVGWFVDRRRALVDVSEKRNEQRAVALRRTLQDVQVLNARLELVAEAVRDGLIAIDARGSIVRFNASSERIFGYARHEVIGESVGILMPEPDRAQHDEYVGRYVRTGEAKFIGPEPREVVARHKDGSTFPLEISVGEISEGDERLFIGVVREITNRKRREVIEAHHKEVLKHTVAEKTEQLRERTLELDESRLETLRKLSLAAEYRDDQTFEHAERVGETCARLGELLGFDSRELELIRQAAPFHDIGKIAVSDTILLKPGSLTPDERQQMQQHAEVGHAILVDSQSQVLSLAAEIALHHHEWWDGSGYPAGLEGVAIPLSARIAAVADVFDSLCDARNYKPAWPVDEAVAEINRLAGHQFDPAAVDAFNQLDPFQLAGSAPTGSHAQPAGQPTETDAERGATSTRNGHHLARKGGEDEASVTPALDRYQGLVERSNDVIFLLDLEGVVVSVNNAGTAILGYLPDETVGTQFLTYLAPADLERAGALFAKLLNGADVVSEELQLIAKDGHPAFLSVSARPIVEDGQLIGIEGIARDVSEQRALLDALTFQALHDPLTGLPNRTLFGDRLTHAIERSRRDGSTVALMLLDLDDFKRINDSLGHGIGDELLVAIAGRLEGELRTSESVMRLGGDEFALIVEDAQTESAMARLAVRLLAAVSAPLPLAERVETVTASLGIVLSQPVDDRISLLRKADVAMYQAKAQGPGRFHFYEPRAPDFPRLEVHPSRPVLVP